MTSALSVTPSRPDSADREQFGFPKSVRILRSSDFRQVYDQGSRFTCPYFAAFWMPAEEQEIGPKVGFTVSRAMGKSVVRNRMRRRMREAVRLHLGEIGLKWRIVFNPRRPILTVASDALEREVGRLVAQCKNS